MSPSRQAVIVVPCFNEEKRLDVARFRAFLADQLTIDLVLVDDGSSDRTIERLMGIRQGWEDRVFIEILEANQGKAEAVRRGLISALALEPGFVGFWDADLATPLSASVEFLATFEEYPHLHWVIGSRVRLLGRHIARRPMRHYLGRTFATAVSMVLGLSVYDTQCGAKLFRASPELATILEEPFGSKWVFDVELLARMIRSRRLSNETAVADVVFEYPLKTWSDVAGSKLTIADFLKAIVEVAVIRRRYFKNNR